MSIITVISNKGGVGKTSIALSTGFYLSAKLRQPTLLMELDSSPGDFGPLLDIEGEKSLEFAVRFPGNFQCYLKKVKDNLYALKGIPNPFTADSIKEKEMDVLLSAISEKYENIVIDTQTIINRPILDACRIAQKIILVTDYSFESVSRVINLYETLTGKYLIVKSKINLIVNKKRFLDFLKVWDFSRLTDIPVNGFISFDRNFDKTIFMANIKKLCSTRLYKQLGRIIESGFNG